MPNTPRHPGNPWFRILCLRRLAIALSACLVHTTPRFAKHSVAHRPRKSGTSSLNFLIHQSLAMQPHKNKTLTSFLALLFGGLGLHRFYLCGKADKWAWLHLVSLPASGLLIALFPDLLLFFGLAPLILSVLIACLETLVIGLTPDEKWDARYNSGSGRTSSSTWPLAVLLVLALGVGATALIATLARSFDLIFTGGSFG
jgi:TM2 domain-containing membrane protein YozV